MPHRYALLECIEHTWLWMAKSSLPIYVGQPVSYLDLPLTKAKQRNLKELRQPIIWRGCLSLWRRIYAGISSSA